MVNWIHIPSRGFINMLVGSLDFQRRWGLLLLWKRWFLTWLVKHQVTNMNNGSWVMDTSAHLLSHLSLSVPSAFIHASYFKELWIIDGIYFTIIHYRNDWYHHFHSIKKQRIWMACYARYVHCQLTKNSTYMLLL